MLRTIFVASRLKFAHCYIAFLGQHRITRRDRRLLPLPHLQELLATLEFDDRPDAHHIMRRTPRRCRDSIQYRAPLMLQVGCVRTSLSLRKKHNIFSRAASDLDVVDDCCRTPTPPSAAVATLEFGRRSPVAHHIARQHRRRCRDSIHKYRASMMIQVACVRTQIAFLGQHRISRPYRRPPPLPHLQAAAGSPRVQQGVRRVSHRKTSSSAST